MGEGVGLRVGLRVGLEVGFGVGGWVGSGVGLLHEREMNERLILLKIEKMRTEWEWDRNGSRSEKRPAQG